MFGSSLNRFAILMNMDKSPLWIPVSMFTSFFCGLAVIFANYTNILPGKASNTYLFVGLGLLFLGFFLASNYE